MLANIKKSASKILGFLIFFSSVGYALKYQDSNILGLGFMYSTLLIGTKTAVEAAKEVYSKKL